MGIAPMGGALSRPLATGFRLSNRPGDFALGFDRHGLHLAGVPLLQREGARLQTRPASEIAKLLGAAYGGAIEAARVMGGLAAVARALDEGAATRAMIAALLLKLPALDFAGAARLAQADDSLRKYDPDEPRDKDGRWTTDGSGESPVSLPDGPRIPELGALLERVANAKPADAADLRADIKRTYHDAGDIRGGDALNRALGDALTPGVTRADRQAILDTYETYTREDPAEAALFQNALVGAGLSGGPAAGEDARPAVAAQPRATPKPAADPNAPSPAWHLGWAERGKEIGRALGQNLPDTFPGIDNFSEDGIATSIKSIDLNAKTYQNPSKLTAKLNSYVDQLDKFKKGSLGETTVTEKKIKGKELHVIIPRGSLSPEKKAVFDNLIKRLGNTNIKVKTSDF